MKKIKIKFVDMGEMNSNGVQFNPMDNFFIDVLNKYFEVCLCDDPDYIIYSDYGDEHCSYDCVRIYYPIEHVVPNFNVCDYSISTSHIAFGDRNFYLPLYFFLLTPQQRDLTKQERSLTEDEMAQKKRFCGFVHANALAKERNEMFDLLSQYKQVSSGGKYRNNTGEYVSDKIEFIKECKFYMAYENTFGFNTERILEGFMGKAIPIYWGDPLVIKEFNPNSFINVHDFASSDDVVERVKEIDQNEILYKQMLGNPIFAEGYTFETKQQELEEYLQHIFSQEPAQAFRRSQVYRGLVAEQQAKVGCRSYFRRIRIAAVLGKMFRPFRNIKFARWVSKKLYFYK